MEHPPPSATDNLKKYWFEKNSYSLDGLPALSDDLHMNASACDEDGNEREFVSCWNEVKDGLVRDEESRMERVKGVRLGSGSSLENGKKKKSGRTVQMWMGKTMSFGVEQKTVMSFVLGMILMSVLNRVGISLL